MSGRIFCLVGVLIALSITSCVQRKMDLEPPKFTSTPTLHPLFVKKDAVVTLTFEANKDLLKVPEVQLKLGGTIRPFTLDATQSNGTKYVFTYAATGDEPELDQSPVSVTMISKTGNKAEDVRAGAVQFDFTPPGCLPGNTVVQLLSDYPANPVLNVSSVTNGTTVSVSFSLDEDLYAAPDDTANNSPTPKVVICLIPDCNPLIAHKVVELDINSSSSGGRSYRFTKKVMSIPYGMDFISKAYIIPGSKGGIIDKAGNSLNAPLEIAQMAIKTTMPTAPNAANIIYRRIPWGMRDPSTQQFTDKKISAVCNACMFSADTEMVLFYNSPSITPGGLIGLTLNPHTGNAWSFTEIILKGPDHARVYMASADLAGNTSLATEIKSAEWVATMGGKKPGNDSENPNRFYTTEFFEPTLEQSHRQEPANGGIELTSQSVPGRWDMAASSTPPSARESHAMAYDSARKRVVLFGGYAAELSSFYNNETWEWNGSKWTQLSPTTKPSARSGHAMAYDSASGKVVLFGGFNNIDKLNDETWEWDGANWTKRTPANKPSARDNHAMAYDNARGKVVLFGGSSGSYNDETWEWDGSDWAQRSPTNKPSARNDHAMAYDSIRGKVVLFGGCCYDNETWEWDGSNWTKRTPLNKPSVRADHAMAYDSTRGKTVLFGGVRYGLGGGLINNETWEWDGSNWINKWTPEIKPSARSDHAMVYDSTRGKVVLFGGWDGSSLKNDTWIWDGAIWTQLLPANKPSARFGHAMAYDSARGKVVLFGGDYYDSASHYKNETWEWDGSDWTQLSPTNKPSARFGHAMAYDSARGKVVLFGGITDTGDSDETWEWDGANWTQPPPIGKPSAMHLHAMAYDGVRRKVVLFGENLFYSRVMTLEWDGSNWIQRLLADKPSLRYGHAMAYDSIYGKVIMFGGFTDTGFSDETWEWDGAANDRPGQIMIVNFGNTGIATDASVQSVSILFNAGGIGYGGANCGMVNGAKMLVWNDKLGRWVDVAANSSPASMLYKLAWSTTDRNFIDHMFVGDNKELNVAVVPVSPNGCGSKMGSVATSYSEVTISYVLP